MDRTITEADLRQLREEMERLYTAAAALMHEAAVASCRYHTEALALMREADAAARRYRGAMPAAYPVEVNNATQEP